PSTDPCSTGLCQYSRHSRFSERILFTVTECHSTGFRNLSLLGGNAVEKKPSLWESRLSRRTFLKGAGAGLAALMVGDGMVPYWSSRAFAAGQWDHEADVIVVGTGAAAFAGAVTARQHGATVIMVEKAPIVGGTTAESGRSEE